MAYPVDKELFPAVTGRDPALGIKGDRVKASEHNKVFDFLERLQDTLGISILGGKASVKARLDDIESNLPVDPILDSSQVGNTWAIGQTKNLWNADAGELTAIANRKIICIITFRIESGTSSGNLELTWRGTGMTAGYNYTMTKNIIVGDKEMLTVTAGFICSGTVTALGFEIKNLTGGTFVVRDRNITIYVK